MTLAAERSRQLRFETSDLGINSDIRSRCEAIGLDPDNLSLGTHDAPVAEAAVEYALSVVGGAAERFYQDPEAFKLSEQKSDIPDILQVHAQQALKATDQTPIYEAIGRVTKNSSRTASLEKQAAIIIESVMSSSRMAMVEAIGELPSVVKNHDTKGYEVLSRVFDAHGLELGDLPADKSTHVDPRNVIPTHKSTVRQNAERIVIGTVAAGTLLSGVAGPAAAAEASPSPSPSTTQSSASVAEINPNGTITSKQDIASSPSTTPAPSVKGSTSTPESGDQSTASTSVAVQAPSTLEVQPNGVVVSAPSSTETQSSSTTTQSSEAGSSDIPVPVASSSPDQVQSPSAAPSETTESPIATPSPSESESGSPEATQSPNALPSSSSNNSPNDTPTTTTDGESNGQQNSQPTGSESQVANTPTNSQLAAPKGFTVPGAGVTYTETPPPTNGLLSQPADSLGQNQKQGGEIASTLIPSIQAPVDRLNQAVAIGNLNALSTGPSSPFSATDPAHPGKVLSMPMDAEQKAQVSAQVQILNGVLAGNPTVVSIVGEYLAQNPASDQSPQSTADNLLEPFVEQGHPDLSLSQKAVLSQLMPTILNPLTKVAKTDTSNAYHAYSIAESIRRHRLQDSGQEGSGSNSGRNGETQRSPESARYSLLLPNIVDKQALAAAIDEHIRQKAPNSPMIGMGIYFVEGGIKWGINPVELAASAFLESQYASDKNSVVVTHNTFNPWNRECPASKPSVTYIDGVSGFHHRACTYLSFKDALMRDDHTGMLAASEGYDSFPQYMHRKFVLNGKTTLPAVMGTFTPVHEQGDARHNLLIHGYMVTMDQIYALAGDAVNFDNQSNTNLNTTQQPNNSQENSSSPILVPSRLQTDPRWANISFNGGTIENSGCGATTYSNALAFVTGIKKETPDKIAQWSHNFDQNGLGLVGETLAIHGKQEFGMNYKELGDSISGVMNELRSGRAVIISGMGYAPFYHGSGHIVLAYGLTKNGNIRISDPMRGPWHTYSPSDISQYMKYAVSVFK